jgi:glucose-6-phosphate isomerase
MQKLTELSSWKALEEHFEQIKGVHMRDLFEQDANVPGSRFKKFSTQMDDILLDFSKNRINVCR